MTLKEFVDHHAALAESRGFAGSILLTDRDYTTLRQLARAEGSLHPADDETVSVDGYHYMTPRRLKGGSWQLRYFRHPTIAETAAEVKRLADQRAIETEKQAAIQAYQRTGDLGPLTAFAAKHPQAAA